VKADEVICSRPDTTGIDAPGDRQQPACYALAQNSPNPSNPSTVVRYELPQASHVTLKVFTMLGQEAATLADEVQELWYKSVEFRESGLASGVHVYALRAGDFIQTRRLVKLHYATRQFSLCFFHSDAD